ncbi:MAG: AmmeMemoRadiSam system radical SAM enzyme [Candidatus Cloacimonetes bacterium]|nr:AmmeMemoRadiSam system radical SAM enzyme [Candidatus Cloacimonadota bacterium]
MKEAEYYQTLNNDKVECLLCPVHCHIMPGNFGRCRSRENVDGKLIVRNFGQTVSLNPNDPVEKKPLYHFLPGQRILSIGANFCNLHCNYCQNYQISQMKATVRDLTREELLLLLQQYDLEAVAFTYTEPVIWYEFVKAASRYLVENGYKTVLVTNGYINPEPLKTLLPYITAMNIDLKSIRDDFYRRNCDGSLQPVLDTIKYAAGKCHIEITNLLITGENDSDEDINDLISFVASVDSRIPLHFSRYYPRYKLQKPETKIQRLHYAYHQAKQKLAHVYLGNIPFENIIYCENCNHALGKRDYNIPFSLLKGKCPHCGHQNYGIWE